MIFIDWLIVIHTKKLTFIV